MYLWLKANSYRIDSFASSYNQLFAQLLARRVDAILVNETVARDHLQSISPAERDPLKKQRFTLVPEFELQFGV